MAVKLGLEAAQRDGAGRRGIILEFLEVEEILAEFLFRDTIRRCVHA